VARLLSPVVRLLFSVPLRLYTVDLQLFSVEQLLLNVELLLFSVEQLLLNVELLLFQEVQICAATQNRNTKSVFLLHERETVKSLPTMSLSEHAGLQLPLEL
jgi:hypothetical protein